MNRVLITGAGGFIGGNLSAYLEARGFQVTRFDISLGNTGHPDIFNHFPSITKSQKTCQNYNK